MPARGQRPPSLRASLRGLARDLRLLGWRSARLARAETQVAARQLAVPLALLAAAIVLGTASLVALVASLVLMLVPLLGTLGAALTVAGATALLAVALLRAAGRRLASISLMPRRTAQLLFGGEPSDAKESTHGPDRRA